jgi:hypothetical protein
LPDKKELKHGDDNARQNTFRRHERVKDQNIEDNSAENCEGERDKDSDQQKQPGENLQRTNYVDVTARQKDAREIAGQILWQLRHRNEMKEGVRTEDDEHEAEEDADDYGENFHSSNMLNRAAQKTILKAVVADALKSTKGRT